MKQASALDALRDEILATHVTPELEAGAIQLVMGDGNPNADIVFIGEAPGKQEDEQGLPFVGASGKFLNEMLAVAGLKREGKKPDTHRQCGSCAVHSNAE